MRIYYLCQDLGIPPSSPKGGAAHLRGFLHALKSLGHEVTLITPHPDRELDVGGGLRIPVVQIPRPDISDGIASAVSPRMARALGHLWTNVAVERTLAGLFRRRRPDMVCERHSPFAVAGVLTCERLGVPHILEVNAPLAWEGRRYRGQALAEAATALERAAFDRASTIVTVSDELKANLISIGVSAAKIVVVPNGVDVEMFAPNGPMSRTAPTDRVSIGFVGSLKPWHGIDLLIEAFRKLAADQRLHLLVLGDGPEARRVDALAEELPGRVTRVGPVPHADVPRYLRAMDIAVAPYPQLEQFYYSPLKVLEYMAVGLPVVASEIGQLRELLRDGDNGCLVPPGDAAILASAIQDLAANPDRRRRLGAAAAADVRRHHTWTQRAGRVLELRQEPA